MYASSRGIAWAIAGKHLFLSLEGERTNDAVQKVFQSLCRSDCLALLAVPTSAQVLLWDNGPLVTDPGAGFNGFDASRLQAGENTLGYGHQLDPALNNRVADDFTVPAAGWPALDYVNFYAYQTGAPQSGSLTAYDVKIWDGAMPGTGNLVGTFNTLDSTGFSGIYRDSSGSPW